MRNRDENLALKSLVVLGETHTEMMRLILTRLEEINVKLDATMGAITDHVNDTHGGEG